jgi:hypothetical protein
MTEDKLRLANACSKYGVDLAVARIKWLYEMCLDKIEGGDERDCYRAEFVGLALYHLEQLQAEMEQDD